MVKFLVALLTLMCMAVNITSASRLSKETQIITRAADRCQTQCGDVAVDFPFGIGPGCSVDGEWFEIVCNKSVIPHTPFLRKLKVQVLNISTDGTLRITNPITSENCSGSHSQTPTQNVNLTGSPFVFSEKRNRFNALSCGLFAYIESKLKDDFVHAGCTSICSSDSNNNNNNKNSYQKNSCDELDCCHTTIPSYTKDFAIAFFREDFSNNNGTKGNRDNNNGAKENYDNKICKYAFVADQQWLHNSTEVLSPGVPGRTHVPVVLNWDLLYNLDYVKSLEKNITSVIPNTTVVCNTSQSRSTRDELSLFCRCQEGYEGNPYDILHGCQAVSECDPDSKPCGRRKDVCVKHHGIYKCIEDSSHSKTIPMIVGFGTGLGVLLIIVAALAFYKFMMKRKDVKRKEKFFKRNGGLLLQKQMSPSNGASMERIKLFNAKELEKATDHFNVDRIIGQGGQGTVFKGMLADGKIVAVKRSKIVDEAKLTEFINEVLILSQINHRNVVKLLGCCLETDVPLLVYEFVPNGNLSQLIHDPHEEFTLTWEMRRRIAIEVTGALSYLHSAASFPIYHRDIKSTNILLDEKYRAKVADFGTSRSVNMDQTHLTTKVQGTFGYLDPEYFRSSQYTEKSDVYSFGVVLIELLSGEKAVHVTSSRKGRSLVTHFIDSMEEGRLFEILDNEVKKGSAEEITVAANLARRCLHLNGRERPTMKEVAMVLEGTQMLEGDSYSVESIEATSVYVSE